VGATSRADVARLGIHVLSPVARVKRPLRYGDGQLAAPFAGPRATCAALLAAALGKPAARGTVVVAFTIQSTYAQTGLKAVRALQGPFARGARAQRAVAIPLYAGRNGLARRGGFGPQGDRAVDWRCTMKGIVMLAAIVLTARLSAQDSSRIAEAQSVLAPLIESYGVSGMEMPVRATVQKLLPAWAKTETDTAGNLWVRVGQGDPVVVFVAHLDEIGYRVDSILDDGSLRITNQGGFFQSLFEAEPALVHTPKGDVPGVFLPRDNRHYTPQSAAAARRRGCNVAPGGAGARRHGRQYHHDAEAVHASRRHARHRPLHGRPRRRRRADLALRHLDRSKLKHQVIFVFSTREEIGLEGARAAATALGITPRRVHAIDTFVSADSPLELQTFAVAKIGDGPVARSLDNSSVTPAAYVDSLAQVARARGLQLQIGTTNGGNDGSMFTPFGVVDVALGWSLRYSHSPAEVIDPARRRRSGRSGPGDRRDLVRALLSVSDKRGLVEFARGLVALGWELVSTGGTAETLRQAGLPVLPVEEVTGFPEMMDGRVKTLHPKVHGGLLAKRSDPGHVRAMREHGITPIDLVAVNLYPFRETVSRPNVRDAQAIEHIDIGGPSMLRSAAKNQQRRDRDRGPRRLHARPDGAAGRQRGGARAAARARGQGLRAHRGLRRRHHRLHEPLQ